MYGSYSSWIQRDIKQVATEEMSVEMTWSATIYLKENLRKIVIIITKAGWKYMFGVWSIGDSPKYLPCFFLIIGFITLYFSSNPNWMALGSLLFCYLILMSQPSNFGFLGNYIILLPMRKITDIAVRHVILQDRWPNIWYSIHLNNLVNL